MKRPCLYNTPVILRFVSEYSRASLFRAKIVPFRIISQDLLTRKFDSHSKLGIAYHVYDITGAEIVQR